MAHAQVYDASKYRLEPTGKMINLPEDLLLGQFRVKLTEPPVVNIYPTEEHWQGSVVVEQHFSFSEDIDMQYKAISSGKPEIPHTIFNEKAQLERFIAQALLNPPAPTAALKRAFTRHKKQLRKKKARRNV